MILARAEVATIQAIKKGGANKEDAVQPVLQKASGKGTKAQAQAQVPPPAPVQAQTTVAHPIPLAITDIFLPLSSVAFLHLNHNNPQVIANKATKNMTD